MIDDNELDTLLSQLTLEEKALLCSGKDFWRLQGIERLNLPSIMVTDGPHGMRKQPDGADHMGLQNSVPATCFPTASALAATWNRDLLQRVGVALGEETRAESVSVLLGPGVNIKRHPLGGRNFEYFSEDPFLAGQIATAWVQGLQSQGVGASLKHFAVNNHEFGRMTVDAIVDERTLREIYLPAFETTVKQAQPWTIMCAYNKLNGTYLAEHPQMLTDILRTEWGFDGLVVTDWGANNNRVDGIRAGQHLDMPNNGRVNTDKIIAAINDGSLTLADLDRSVREVLKLILRARTANEDAHPRQANLEEHHTLAIEAAEQGAVLLKNDDNRLPLKNSGRVLVLGALANQTRYQGSGSSQINPYRLVQPLDALKQEAPDIDWVYQEGYRLKGDLTHQHKLNALAEAERADAIVLFAGLTPEYESEGFDRKHLQLPRQQRDLIEALLPHADKLVLVLQNGAPIVIPHVDKIPAIFEAYLGGQAGGQAIARLLLGKANPSGKLAETFPAEQADVASDRWFPGTLRQSQYREGIWVGYRYHDTAGVPPLFPFGHGLSYSRFDYQDLQIEGDDLRNDGVIAVSMTVINSGDRDGHETVQLYVGQAHPSVPRPKKELRQFEKVFLKAGESCVIRFVLSARDFSFWDVQTGQWRVETDDYTLSVAASVEDIRLQQSIAVVTDHERREPDETLTAYYNPDPEQFSESAFAALLGHKVPAPVPTRPFHVNSTIGEVQHRWLGRRLKRTLMEELGGTMGDLPEENRLMMEAMIDDLPLRNRSLLSLGAVSEKTVHRLVHALNHHWLKALTGAKAPSK
ncbi:glycoside hydrolase family 3 C-terminal domain-containing protein [Reinekea blandensis]|uniref:Beta-D-glucoside glucohydrolase n=1 Tax=Reinekea blandensis MED297 TaxID=314283 RepID=A4BJ67_9GAMM|nr:glycoside hydrolase family 3 C-terminal domain-containing protein [Reinekea blandensis]EAR07820.1 putative glycosyl hydrolase [Reinekea sp. MED297] [Reinekea blandensis MED297]